MESSTDTAPQSGTSSAKTDEAAPLSFVLPPEVEAYRDDLRRFVDAMIYKLRRNAHKGRWEDVDMTRGFMLLRGEVDELEGAVAEGNSTEIVLEGADVANFAMIMASIATERGK